MEFAFEPWHWFVLGVLLMLSELILPAFAALWFGIAAIMVGILYWMFPMMGVTTQFVTGLFCRFYALYFGLNLLNRFRLTKPKQDCLAKQPSVKLAW